MRINAKHPFLKLSPHVVEICKPLQEIGISYFTYTKTEDSGTRTDSMVVETNADEELPVQTIFIDQGTVLFTIPEIRGLQPLTRVLPTTDVLEEKEPMVSSDHFNRQGM